MKFNLTRLSLFALICLMSVSVVMATPTCGNSQLSNGLPPSSPPSPYENADGSQNGYVCDFGGLEFSNFFSNTSPTTPNQVGVTPQFQPGTTPPNTNPGFFFNGPFQVGAGQSQDVSISFTVTALTGLLTDVHISLNNSHVFGGGTGNVSYTERVCLSSSNCTLFVDDPLTGSLETDLVLTTPQQSITINKDLILSGGNSTLVTMSGFANYYSHTVPEPRTVSVVLSIAFFGLVVFMKKRQAVRS